VVNPWKESGARFTMECESCEEWQNDRELIGERSDEAKHQQSVAQDGIGLDVAKAFEKLPIPINGASTG